METIVGTAGHIDHGKTALVKALTGVDADRLPEEKRRGITIDIGFAEMSVGDAHFGFVDVPGHERFVKNMLAGASGIDLVLLVVAADEGVMPQTREHFDICRLLGVESGLIALTKSDLVDAETLDIARLDVAELVAGSFLENAAVVAVSSKTGEGIDELRAKLVEQAGGHRRHENGLVTSLPIDRSFSVKGFGAVVTGTLSSGEIVEGDELELLPSGAKVRVRGLQSHGQTATRVGAGRRVAVNLGGVDHADITRGMSLVAMNTLRPTQEFDAEVSLLLSAPRPLRSRQRVRVHLGTAEALARLQILNGAAEIAPGRTDLAQLRFESPVVAVPGQRFIIRSYSPQMTIAGGVVIDNAPGRHRRRELTAVRDLLSSIHLAPEVDTSVRLLVDAAGMHGLSFAELQAKTGLRKQVLNTALDRNLEKRTIADLAGRYLAAPTVQAMLDNVTREMTAFHKAEPLAKGMNRETLRERAFGFLASDLYEQALAAAAAAGLVILDKETVRLATHTAELSPEEKLVSDRILSAYSAARLEVPKVDEVLGATIAGTRLALPDARRLLQRLMDNGQIVKVTDEFSFSKRAVDELREKLETFAAATGDRLIDVSKFKDIAGVSRKYAIPLLEYFDRIHVTARAGDKRVIL